jgi:hypothetical protein
MRSIAPVDLKAPDWLVEALRGERPRSGEADSLSAAEVVHPDETTMQSVCRWRSFRLVRSRWDCGECEIIHRDEGTAMKTVEQEQVVSAALGLPPMPTELCGA